jgi:hypothetical protein
VNEHWIAWLFVIAWAAFTAWMVVGTIKVLRDYQRSTEKLQRAVAEVARLDAIAGALLDEKEGEER